MTLRPRLWTTALLSAVVLAVVGLLGAAAAWHHDGGRWFVVTSPSMGEAMPVGTLLLTRPTTVDRVEVGDVITFDSPQTRIVFSHRVVDTGPAGLTTRGDVNQVDDAWTITDADLIGMVRWRLPLVGWALRAVPLLLLGLALTVLVSAVVRRERRFGLRLVGASFTLAAASWVFHPWLGLEQLSRTSSDDGSPGAVMQVVSTGVLPTQAFEVGGDAEATLRNGQVGTLHLTHATDGRYGVAARLDLPWWGWALLVLVVLAPLALALLRGVPATHDLERDDEGDAQGADESQTRVELAGLLG